MTLADVRRRLPVVAVVDTGVDDALALVVAARHPALDLRAVVCTAGNVGLDQVVANTRYVLEVCGSAAPVYAGADRRLDGSPFPVRDVHGPDGLAGIGRAPEHDVRPAGWPEVAHEATVVALGPLTSLAGAAPKRVFASYARPGEPNFEMDSDAAAAVTYHPVDVPDHTVTALRPTAEAAAPDEVSRLVATLLAHQVNRGAGFGDAAVVLTVAEPRLPPDQWPRRIAELTGLRD